MSASKRKLVGLLLYIGLFAGGIALLKTGIYGLEIFVIAPWIIGAIASFIVRPQSGRAAVGVGMLATLLGTCSLLAVGLEGLLCIVMALPLALPLGALGSWMVYMGDRSKAAASGSMAMFLLFTPAGLIWDVNAKPDIFPVHSSIEIAATPEQVWKHVVTFSDMPEPTEWYFQTGLAYPQRARIVGTGVGAIRYCEFSTGPFVEPIETWDEPRLLQFSVAKNPAPMHEWSPYAQVLPKHLHGYLISKHGEFRLTPLGDHRTLLEGTTWYQHSLWPATYWRWWSDAIIHRIHLRVLTHIQTLAEADNGDVPVIAK